MWFIFLLLVLLFALYYLGVLPFSRKRATMFFDTSFRKRRYVGASFVSCVGRMQRILRMRTDGEYVFHFASTLRKGAVTVQILNSEKVPILELSKETPNDRIYLERGKRYYILTNFIYASGAYELSWEQEA